MDINSLLSPQDTPRVTPSPPSNASSKKSRKPRSSKLTNNKSIVASPLSKTTLPPQTLSHGAVLHPQHTIPSPPMISPVSALRRSGASLSPADGTRASRQPSTPGMDTLADLASMQHHQQTARVKSGGLRSAEIYENQSSPGSNPANPHPTSRSQGGMRSSMDLTMSDVPQQPPMPRTYAASSLSEADLETVAQLVGYLATNPFAYESHVQLVKLLHQGLTSHIRARSSSASPGNPRTYDLLRDLLNAREAMNVRFALGEDLWMEWIQDQKLLADTLDDSITVMEACKKAVEEEAGSTKLWLLYGEWMLSMYTVANSHDQRTKSIKEPPSEVQRWSEEDKMVAREICSWQQMMEVWSQAIRDTRWRLNDSHLLWDRYTELLMHDLANSPSPSAIATMKVHFLDRLQTPHAKWDQTFQSFSSFISRYDNAAYEDTMITVNRQSASARSTYSLREIFEFNKQRAIENHDKEAEWSAFVEYIDWEFNQSRKTNPFAFEMLNALYQRATLRFPTDTNLWEGYIMFLYDEIVRYPQRSLAALPVLERATRHCPWSGTLWAQYLLAAERSNLPFTDIGRLKHRATSTGLLDAGGMQEVLKVHNAWCGFLRRRAFQQDATDEDLDVAEVGIRSAIEDMETLGQAKHGKDYNGDPENRLERIYIKHLTQSRNWESARNFWKSLVSKQGDSYDFWLRYYLWEMGLWGKMAYTENDSNGGGPPLNPSEATKVLRQAMARPNLDWPEKILETFQYHCEDHEDAAELQAAVVQIWKRKRLIKKRREKEAAEAYEAAELQSVRPPQQIQQENLIEPHSNLNGGKRKRQGEHDPAEIYISKKCRQNVPAEMEIEANDQPPVAPLNLKRDRENTTIIVKNLPPQTIDTRVRQYFRDCGTINSLKLLPGDDGDSATATIEFDSKEDVLTAQTKDMKTFDGNAIEVQVGTGSTLFVTNFPPTADDAFIREKFGKYGEIVDIRFPSLKYNTHRRFCYVQFKYSNQAQAAIEMDGHFLGGKLKLVAKISDPGHKQGRQGALYEGREIYISNVDWSTTEEEMSQIFSKYGTVERVRMPVNVAGKSKGIAFVVFSTKDEAIAALDMNLTKLKTRLLNVSISTNNPAKRQATTIITSTNPHSSTSPSPEEPHIITNGETNPNHGAASPTPTTITDPKCFTSSSEIKSRTLALLNVPDTINDARIRALVEPFGSLVKIILRPDHQGAIIEFQYVASVGKASLGLDGVEISPGRRLGVGSVGEMLHQKAEVKSDRIGAAKKENGEKQVQISLQVATPIRRPGQPGKGARRGGKGGLGLKRAGFGLRVNDRVKGEGDDGGGEGEGEGEGKAKSNADFKAIFLK